MTTHNRTLLRAALAAAFTLSILLLDRGPSSYAATYTVTKTADTADGACDGDCSLREAIIAANSSAATPDTISLPAGTFTLTRAGADNTAILGDLDITNNLTFINGSGPASTIIDGGDIDRVFEIALGKNVTFSGLTIRNGNTLAQGGGFTAATSSTVTLNNVVVTSNDANDGGGIWSGGSLTIDDSTISGNLAYSTGGGIFNGDSTGTLTLTDSTLSANAAGGAGGGGLTNYHNANLYNVTITDNYATGSGGGGGGIYNHTTTDLNLINVTISHNTSTSATNGGGIRNTSTASTDLWNSIVANNTGGGGNCSSGVGHAPVTNAGGNLDSGTTCGLGLSNANANLGALTNNGGQTLTRALIAGSQAINAAINANCPAADQRGVARSDGACDIGAYEVAAGPTPTPTPTPAPTPSPTSDVDGDGFTLAAETHLSTNPNDPCGPGAWPADLAGNDNILNIGDLSSFLFPTRPSNDGHGTFNKFGHPVPDSDVNIIRWDLDANNVIGIGDLNALNPAVLAPTARPPMFGGQPAFFTNGGLCPFPP